MSLESKVQNVWASPGQDRYRSFKLLRTILGNIIQNPTEKKYQKLKIAAIKPKLPATGAVDLLFAAGFVEGPTHYSATGENPAAQAQIVLDAIDAEENRRKASEMKEREDTINQIANENKKRKMEAEKEAAKDKEDIAKRLAYFKDKSDQAKKRLPGAIEEEIKAAKEKEPEAGGEPSTQSSSDSTTTDSTSVSSSSSSDSSTTSTTASNDDTEDSADSGAELAKALALSLQPSEAQKDTTEMTDGELDGEMLSIIEDLKFRKEKEKDSDKDSSKKDIPEGKKLAEMTKEEKMEWVEMRRQQVRDKRAKQSTENEKNKEKSRKEQAKAAMALQEKIQEANLKAAIAARKKADEDKKKSKEGYSSQN